MFGLLSALADRYGDVVGFDLGASPCILVNGAPQVRELLVEREACLRKPEFVKDSNRGHWGDGLTTFEGPVWRARRRVLRPFFSARPVSARLAIVAECTNQMLEAWAPESQADLIRELRMLTARIAARVVLDAELEGYGPVEGRSGVLPVAEMFGEDYASTAGGDPTAPLVMVRPRAPRRMDETVRLIDERLGSGEVRNDILSELVQARLPDGHRLTRDDVVGEIIQMLFAGHLTIPSSLGHFFKDIAAAGDVATTLAIEAERLCATDIPESAAIASSYCVAALKESMRLHPPAPILYREVAQPFDLDGFAFARDTAVWVSPQLLHHDPRYFPQPERFLPERFRSGPLPVPSAWAYLPFGAGPRTCVGNHQALQQLSLTSLLMSRRITLASILDIVRRES